MKYRMLFKFMVGVFVLSFFLVPVLGVEKLGRGLVALELEDGSVFLSWRLLDTDPEDIAFEIKRRSSDQGIDLTGGKPYRPTNFTDKTLGRDIIGKTCIYELYKAGKKRNSTKSELLDKANITPSGKGKPYISIALNGDYDFKRVGIADLDGDGTYEYIIQQPNFNIDPYQKSGYWKKSPTTYKIEAYRADGTMLWRHDMGWSIELGTWYSPWIVYDVDGDGKAEVYCKAGEGDPRDEKGLVKSGPEYLVKIDGQTGKVIAKTDWLSRDGYKNYNYSSRNFLTVAYLDGKTPSLIMQRGTYGTIKTLAMDKDFNRIWYWSVPYGDKNVRRVGSHGLITADIDEDGRDELVIGGAVLDDNGKKLWSLNMKHPDICYAADIDPDNPGMEIFYGFESNHKTDGICLVDAKTGRKLWTHKEPTYHIHTTGMVADILADFEGIEVYAGESDYPKRWLYSAKGKLIQFLTDEVLNPKPLWWDADPQKEVITQKYTAPSGTIRDWGGQALQQFQGRAIAVVDCLGDHREEVITSLEGELRIYSTTIGTLERRPCLMQDHQYRMGVVAQTMGYYYPAQLGK